MLPILPRKLLWTDLKTMDQFFELEPLNREFANVLLRVRKKDADSALVAPLIIFNDAYYSVTRLLYEAKTDRRGMTGRFPELPYGPGRAAAMALAYHLLTLCDDVGCGVESGTISNLSDEIHPAVIRQSILVWREFEHLAESLSSEGIRLSYGFMPRPIPYKILRKYDIDWEEVTCYYDEECIKSVMNLWERFQDKINVGMMIEKYKKDPTPKIGRSLDGEIIIFQARIKELEDEVARLKAELEGKAAEQEADAPEDDVKDDDTQDDKPEEEVRLSIIHQSLDEEEARKVQEELKRLVTKPNAKVYDICEALFQMKKEGKVTLIASPGAVYEELKSLGMSTGRGFSYENFQKYYKKVHDRK